MNAMLSRFILAVTLALGLLAPAQGAEVGTRRVLLGGNLPSLAAQFGFTTDCNGKTNKFYGSCNITVSRASTAYENDQNNNWYPFGNNVTRLTNRGWLFEEQRTNGIRNNKMTGAVVGTPGTLPNDWAMNLNGTGVSTQVVAITTINGVDVLRFRFFGTPSASADLLINFEGGTVIAAAYGQTWTESGFIDIAAGSLTNISAVFFSQAERNSGGGSTVNNNGTSFTPNATFTRYSYSATFTGSATAFVRPDLHLTVSNGNAIDVTIDIGWPQEENNTGIDSSVTSATVNAGGTGYGATATGTMTWSGTGCITNPVLNVTTNAGGAITTVNSVTTAGNCVTFPAAGATTWTPGGGLSAGSNATFNLTPTNNATQAFASSPIPTTGGAVTRAADVPNSFTEAYGNALTEFLQFVPETPAAGFFGYGISAYDTDVTPNSLELIGASNNFGELIGVASNSVNVAVQTLAGLTQNVSSRLCGSASVAGPFALSRDGATQSTGSATGPAGNTLSKLLIGISPNHATPLNGYVERYGLNPSAGLTAAQCNTITASTFQ